MDWFHQWDSLHVAQCFLIPTFPFCFCSSQWFVMWVSWTPVIIYRQPWSLFQKNLYADRDVCECDFKGLPSSLTHSIAGYFGGVGAGQVYGFKLIRTFIIYLFIFNIFFLFDLDNFQSLYSTCYNIASSSSSFFFKCFGFLALRHTGC